VIRKTSIAARLDALRITLFELDFIPESENLRQLRHILMKRITELNDSAIRAPAPRPIDNRGPSIKTRDTLFVVPNRS